MADVDAPLALAAEFPPADHAAWLALAGDVERLRTTTYDGITIEPLYTAADEVADTGLPGRFPFVRGRSATGTRDGWDVRQIVSAADGRGAAAAELEHGATSLWLQLGDEPVDEQSLGRLLEGVLLDIAPVVLDAGSRWIDAASAMRTIWERQHVDPAAVSGSFGADPFGALAGERDTDRLGSELTALLVEARALVADHPNVHVATIDGTRFHDAGATDAQELGDAIAVVVATLRALTDGGVDTASAFGLLELRLAATVDQFATIAKFRAARRLLARVAEVAGEPEAAGRLPLHAVTSRAMTTRYDAPVNIVRATVACFSAAVAGADAVSVLPYDAVVRPAGELATRLARNTQTVLGLESNVARVIDAAGGSWYVERLTDQLAERAWDVFQEVEAAGGFRAAVANGIVDDRISAARASRIADVDHRRAPIVGVSEFPNAGDAPPRWPENDWDGVHRWAAGFEELRMRVDAVSTTSKRPAVFLATLGPAASSARRATAAVNFFAIAGLDTLGAPVTEDIGEIARAFADSATPVACICAGDETARDGADDLRDALVATGATRVYSAADLGGDARGELADLLEQLGVP